MAVNGWLYSVSYCATGDAEVIPFFVCLSGDICVARK